MILSGLLLEQVDEVLAIFCEAGFSLDARAEEGEWGALCLRQIPRP